MSQIQNFYKNREIEVGYIIIALFATGSPLR